MTPFKILILPALVAVTLGVTAWGAEKKLKVVTATESLKSIVEAVGGDRVEVDAIARSGDDPHFIEVKPSYILRLRKADMIVKIGMELDPWMDAIARQAGNRAILKGQSGHVDASQGIEVLEVPAVLDRSQGDVHPFGNPHYWLDPENGKRISCTVCDALCRLDPGSTKDYQDRRDAFGKRLEEKLAAWEKRLAPFKGAPVVTYHRSWSYFMRRFGLTVSVELESKPGIPPSAEHLEKVVTMSKAQGVRCILQQPFNPEKPGRYISEKAGGIPLLVLDSEPAPDKGVPDYLGMFDRDIEALATALEKKP